MKLSQILNLSVTLQLLSPAFGQRRDKLSERNGMERGPDIQHHNYLGPAFDEGFLGDVDADIVNGDEVNPPFKVRRLLSTITCFPTLTL